MLLPECSAWWGALEGGASPAWLVRSANGEAARVAAPLLEAVLPDAAASSNPPWQWFADPACPAPVMPVSAAKLAPLSVAALAQRAATSAWDLRQFRYATPDRAARVLAWGTRLMQQRSGRFALAAMVALAAVNIIGLNLYAMKQQRAIAARHDTMEAIVTQALPGAPRILEPAMQLESAWRKTRGAANSASGAAALLEALARTNATTALTTLEVSERQLRARFANADGLKAALAGCAPGAAQPVRCTRDGDQLLIEHVNPPASPAGKTG